MSDQQSAETRDAPESKSAYQALYRRFRPQRFDEVLGQEHVTRALRSAVREGRVAHAYLFSGPRGTGKTSTARILAMALNCEHPTDGEPDGACDSCIAIRRGSSMDVQELDAASNRRIDDVRDLLGRVSLGTPGRWKLYIIDEVHQLTPDASTALLKTLEEPPAHVIFVLATTDPQKVLETIRSRTQHYEFRLLGSDVLAGLLEDVARRADLELPSGAIEAVVRRGRGSARDALSALDQVAALGATTDDTDEMVAGLIDSLVGRDAGGALVSVAEAARAGLDPRRVANALVEHLRNLFLANRAPELVMLGSRQLADARQKAELLGPASLVRSIEVLGQALIDMRDSADPRVTLEVALVRLAAPEIDDSRPALLERVESLEKALAALDASGSGRPPEQPTTLDQSPPPPAAPAPPPSVSGRDAAKSALGAHRGPPRERPSGSTPEVGANSGRSAPAPDLPTAGSPGGAPSNQPVSSQGLPSRDELTIAWGDHILPGLRPAVKVYVATGRFLSVGPEGAVYAVPDQGLLSRAQPGLDEVEEALRSYFGRPVPLKLVLDDPSAIRAAGAAEPYTTPAGARVPDDDPADYVLADMEDAAGDVMSPERRLMEAFPGAEEVTG
jgi:DNA polymerase III subunit gamma/tau